MIIEPVHDGPLRIAEHDNRNPVPSQVLLVSDVFIRGEQHIEPGVLRRLEQFAVR